MQYWQWYEWLFWALGTSIAVWIFFEVLDGVLDRILQYRIQKELTEMNRTAALEDRCYGCGEPKDNGQAHGLNQGYGGCV